MTVSPPGPEGLATSSANSRLPAAEATDIQGDFWSGVLPVVRTIELFDHEFPCVKS